MKSNIRERNDSAEQWKGGIFFHSIYYRYFSFIFALLILFFYVVGRRKGLETLDVDLSLVQLQLSPGEFALYGNGILLLFSIPFYFYKKLKRRDLPSRHKTVCTLGGDYRCKPCLDFRGKSHQKRRRLSL